VRRRLHFIRDCIEVSRGPLKLNRGFDRVLKIHAEASGPGAGGGPATKVVTTERGCTGPSGWKAGAAEEMAHEAR
jgi:hypothetical protein